MREILTFVLRLVIDTDEPGTMRGVLHAVVDNEDHFFTNEQALLETLRMLSHAPGKPLRDCGGNGDGI